MRDRLWLWGHEAEAQNTEWNLPRPSRMTAVEAAVYLGIPNLLMVRYRGTPVMPFDQHAIAMRPLRRVMWSLVGAEGEASHEEQEHVFEIAGRFPNITGLVLDDFLNWDTLQPEVTVEQLRTFNTRLSLSDGRRLDLMMILYSHQLEVDVAAHLAYCNQISLWTWYAKDLPRLDQHLARLETIAPNHQRFLGVYLWDMGPRAEKPLAALQEECTRALTWLREGRIAGIIFLASCVCDLELATVEWLRGWLAAVADEPL